LKKQDKPLELRGKNRNYFKLTDKPYFNILKGILEHYEPIPKAIEFHNATQPHRGLKGGVGAGKTYTLAADDILVSFLNAPHYHLSTSPSFDNARVTVLPAFIEICEYNKLDYEWLISKNLFRIIHNYCGKDRIANILILGTDKPHFMKGINAASGSMNEPFSQKKEAFKIWWERIRVKAPRLSRTWAGTAEPDKMQWGWEYFDEQQTETADLYTDTISTYANENLPEEYKKGLEEIYDDKMKEVYMLGKCINLTTGKAYYAFDKSIHVINAEYEAAAKEGLQVIISFDFNVNPMCAVEIVFDRIEGASFSHVYYQVMEYKISSSRTDELCDMILDAISRRYDFKTTSFIITGDATGTRKSTRNEYNDFDIIIQKFDEYNSKLEKGAQINFGKMIPDTNPQVRDRVNYVNNLFEKRKLFICGNSKETARDFNLVSWKKGAEKFSLDKSQKDLTHLSDAVGYALWNTKQFIYDDYLSSDKLILLKARMSRFW
jgi:hypothetical protein